MKPIAHLVVAAAFILSACASGSGPIIESASARESSDHSGFSPPPLNLIADGGDAVELQSFAYCWSGGDVTLCADGDPSFVEGQTLAGTATFSIEWPLEDWSWTVESHTAGGQCDAVLPRITNQDRGMPIDVPSGGDLVFVSGSGPEGSATYAFRPSFESEATTSGAVAAVGFARPDAKPVDASRLTVWLSNLPEEPADFSASAFVQGHAGRVATFELVPAVPPDCFAGRLAAAVAPDAAGISLAGFAVPIRISVDAVIDGIAFRTDAVVWPDDFRTGSDLSPTLSLNEIAR